MVFYRMAVDSWSAIYRLIKAAIYKDANCRTWLLRKALWSSRSLAPPSGCSRLGHIESVSLAPEPLGLRPLVDYSICQAIDCLCITALRESRTRFISSTCWDYLSLISSISSSLPYPPSRPCPTSCLRDILSLSKCSSDYNLYTSSCTVSMMSSMLFSSV